MSDAAMRWQLAGEDGQTSLLEPPGGAVSPRRDLPSVEYLHVQAKRIISAVPPRSRMPFRYTINAYRGCTHACTYCFARPTHVFLGLDGGRDFERRIVVKVNAVERLRAELADPRWTGEHIAMGTNTDPYQPAEGRYRLTRGLVEALGAAGNPFSILTKSSMILRDLDVLQAAAARTAVRVNLSIGTLDEEAWRLSEPGTPPPARRLEAVRRLNEAGIECGVLVAPVLPGLSDGPGVVERTVAACLDAGAASVSAILLHLRPGVRELYMPWLEDVRPDLLDRYAELYARPGGYAPKADQEALTRRVHAAIERHPRPARPGRSWRTGLSAQAARGLPSAPRGGVTPLAAVPAQPALFP